MTPTLSRRTIAGLLLALPFAIALPTLAQEQPIGMEDVLNDPEAPVVGPDDADVTIVAFLDYNCPFCKQSAPHLKELMETDAKVRVIFKDWPILTEASVYGAQIALAAKYQGAYTTAHDALMAIPGTRITNEAMLEAVRASGIDMTKLQSALDENGQAISDLIRRNLAQADAMGLTGTPVYLIGPYLANGALDIATFREIVAQARAEPAAQ